MHSFILIAGSLGAKKTTIYHVLCPLYKRVSSLWTSSEE